MQVGQNGRVPQIGRLHKIEAQEGDFSKIGLGDRISVKILKVTQDSDRQLIELTRRKEHMDMPSGHLNDKLLSLLSLETIKEG